MKEKLKNLASRLGPPTYPWLAAFYVICAVLLSSVIVGIYMGIVLTVGLTVLEVLS